MARFRLHSIRIVQGHAPPALKYSVEKAHAWRSGDSSYPAQTHTDASSHTLASEASGAAATACVHVCPLVAPSQMPSSSSSLAACSGGGTSRLPPRPPRPKARSPR
eukprot:5797889-Prymnesium_polylepis.1